jgi:hypothetical protein
MDSRIARRWQIDPEKDDLTELSPFSINNNSPISVSDPDGHFGVLGAIIGAVGGAVADAGYQVYKGMKDGQSIGKAFSGIKWGEVGAAAAGGAVAGATMGLAAPLVTSMGGAAVISQAGAAYVYGGMAIISTFTGSMVKNAIKGKGKIDGQEVIYDVSFAIPDLILGGIISYLGENFTKTASKEALKEFRKGTKEMKKQITKDLRNNGVGRRKANKLANDALRKLEKRIEDGYYPKAIKIKVGTEVTKVTVSGISAGKLESYKESEKK